MDAHGVRVRGRGEDHTGHGGADGGDGERREARGRLARQRNPSGEIRGRRDEVERGTGGRDRWGGGDARSRRRTAPNLSEQLSPDFYARQSPAFTGQLSRFRPCTAAGEEMNRAAWVEIRLG
ncbi:hypothetical protein SY2F82_72620 [Streptomyces sp. Y2F8-2]|nr:hypothetical protein SY2F82_72620 [Streptomyces sp. Y2F8-2]